MAEKRAFEDRDNVAAIRNAERSDTHEVEHPPHRYVDPAQEVMNSNPNISPPIHPLPN